MCIRLFALPFRRHYLSTHEHLHTLYTPNHYYHPYHAAYNTEYIKWAYFSSSSHVRVLFFLLSFLWFLSFSSLRTFFDDSRLSAKHMQRWTVNWKPSFSNIHLFECCELFFFVCRKWNGASNAVIPCCLFYFVFFSLFFVCFEAEEIHFMTKLRLMNNFVTDHRMMCNFN